MHKVVTGDAILIFDMDKKQNENVIYIVVPVQIVRLVKC